MRERNGFFGRWYAPIAEMIHLPCAARSNGLHLQRRLEDLGQHGSRHTREHIAAGVADLGFRRVQLSDCSAARTVRELDHDARKGGQNIPG